MYDISYKNMIILDFIDYIEEKLIIPSDYLYLPAFRKDYSSEKEILFWKDFKSQEIFDVSGKVEGKRNRTFVAIYSNRGDNFFVQIYAFGINFYSSFTKYKEQIKLPEIDIPTNIVI